MNIIHSNGPYPIIRPLQADRQSQSQRWQTPCWSMPWIQRMQMRQVGFLPSALAQQHTAPVTWEAGVHLGFNSKNQLFIKKESRRSCSRQRALPPMNIPNMTDRRKRRRRRKGRRRRRRWLSAAELILWFHLTVKWKSLRWPHRGHLTRLSCWSCSCSSSCSWHFVKLDLFLSLSRHSSLSLSFLSRFIPPPSPPAVLPPPWIPSDVSFFLSLSLSLSLLDYCCLLNLIMFPKK